jgi:hypothetical protein
MKKSQKNPRSTHFINFQILVDGATLNKNQESELNKALAATVTKTLQTKHPQAAVTIIPGPGRKITP